LVEWLDKDRGVGWQEDDFDIRICHLQHPSIARSVIHQQKDLEEEVLYCQVSLHLRDETVVDPIHADGSCYPRLFVGSPTYEQCVLLFDLNVGFGMLQHHQFDHAILFGVGTEEKRYQVLCSFDSRCFLLSL